MADSAKTNAGMLVESVLTMVIDREVEAYPISATSIT
jgi:hypothetical protein